MKMEVGPGNSLRLGSLEEGDLFPSLDDLMLPPRLRGEISLKEGELTGWLIDGWAPNLALRLIVVVGGRKVASATTPPARRRNGRLSSSGCQFTLRWDDRSSRRAKPVSLHVLCGDGTSYELIVEASTEEIVAEPPVDQSRFVTFETKPSPKAHSEASTGLEEGLGQLSSDRDSTESVTVLPTETSGVVDAQLESKNLGGDDRDKASILNLRDQPHHEEVSGAEPGLGVVESTQPLVGAGTQEELTEIALAVPDADTQMRAIEPEFDRAYYLKENSDVEAAGVDALIHYFYTGWREGRNPTADFNTKYYLTLAAEVGPEGPNPFWHYLAVGKGLGRACLPPASGLEENASASANEPPELASIRSEFDPEYYLATYPDVAKANLDPLLHFFYTGWKEGRNPNDEFDTSYYLAVNVDVQDASLNPFWHFIVSGRAEGRLPRRPGGYRRSIIDAAISPHLRDPANLDPDEKERAPKELGPAIERIRKASRGMVVSLSHDCYTRVIGGTQIFVSDEQRRFNEQGFTYLHLSPQIALLRLAPESKKFLVRIVINGSYEGLFDFKAVSDYLKTHRAGAEFERYLVVHCALGFHVPNIVQLHQALRPKKSFYWLHDYSSVCEGFNLLRNDVEFCGAPATNSLACRVCVYGESRVRHLEQMALLFEHCGFDVLSPSQFALDLWKRSTNLLYRSAAAHPHWTLQKKAARPKALAQKAPISIAFLGFPSSGKGWPLFAHIVREFGNDPRYKFFHFAARDVATIPKVSFVQTEVSPDSRDAAISSLIDNNIQVLLFLSPWPETFSFVAHEAVAAGVSVFCLRDSGNVSSLVERHGVGKVFDGVSDIVEFLNDGAIEFLAKQASSHFAFKIENTGTTASAVFSELQEWRA